MYIHLEDKPSLARFTRSLTIKEKVYILVKLLNY